MKKHTIIAFLMSLTIFFAIGTGVRGSAFADDTAAKTPEQLVDEGVEYFYAYNGKPYDKEKAASLFEEAGEQGNGLAYFFLGDLVQRSTEPDRFEKALAYYEKAIELGCDRGLLGKGDLLEYGRGMERDSEQARQLYEEALSRGCVQANIELGDYYRDGVGVARDYVKALEYYTAFLNDESTAELDTDPYAKIGYLYRDGIAGIQRDYQEALNWYNKGRDAGKSPSIYNLGYMYYWGYGVNRDYDKAFAYYVEAADMGNTLAMRAVGNMYIDSKVDTMSWNPGTAERWFLKAADAGYSSAYISLSNLYMSNYYTYKNVTEEDRSKALDWLQKGIDEGYTDCMTAMGDYYRWEELSGKDDKSDTDLALEYYDLARFAGNVDAYNLTGLLYRDRLSDGKQAIEWFKKGAELGDMYCMYNLGRIYNSGFKGDVAVSKSMSASKEWFTKAAETGNANAISTLGDFYYVGYLGQQSTHKAQEYYSEAAARGEAWSMWCIGHRFHGNSLLEPLDMREEVERACYWYAKAMEIYGDGNDEWVMEYIEGLIDYTSLDQETADRIMKDVHENFRMG